MLPPPTVFLSIRAGQERRARKGDSTTNSSVRRLESASSSRGPGAGLLRLLALTLLHLRGGRHVDAFSFFIAGRPTVSAQHRTLRARTASSSMPRSRLRADAPVFAAGLGQESSPHHQRARTYYDILGAPPTATRAELKRRYVELARRTHPDALIGRDTTAAADGLPDFTEVAAAYKILSDPLQRKRYDRSLLADEFVEETSRLAVKVGGAVGEAFDGVAIPLFRKAAMTVAEDLKPRTEQMLNAAWKGTVEIANRAKEEQEKLQREAAERERVERERARSMKEKAERERVEREKAEGERAEKMRAERARAKKEETEKEKARRKLHPNKRGLEERARLQSHKEDISPKSNADLVRSLGVKSTLIESGDLKDSLDSVKADLEEVMRMSHARAPASSEAKATNSYSRGSGKRKRKKRTRGSGGSRGRKVKAKS